MHKQKYLKYKQKYLTLKDKLIGGSKSGYKYSSPDPIKFKKAKEIVNKYLKKWIECSEFSKDILKNYKKFEIRRSHIYGICDLRLTDKKLLARIQTDSKSIIPYKTIYENIYSFFARSNTETSIIKTNNILSCIINKFINFNKNICSNVGVINLSLSNNYELYNTENKYYLENEINNFNQFINEILNICNNKNIFFINISGWTNIGGHAMCLLFKKINEKQFEVWFFNPNSFYKYRGVYKLNAWTSPIVNEIDSLITKYNTISSVNLKFNGSIFKHIIDKYETTLEGSKILDKYSILNTNPTGTCSILCYHLILLIILNPKKTLNDIIIYKMEKLDQWNSKSIHGITLMEKLFLNFLYFLIFDENHGHFNKGNPYKEYTEILLNKYYSDPEICLFGLSKETGTDLKILKNDKYVFIKQYNNSNATSIEDSAFEDCMLLTSIDLPKVTEIGDHVFANCKSLEIINIPQVTEVSLSAFKKCILLTSIDLPQVTKISWNAFDNCVSLKTINIPQVTCIDYGAFKNCILLTSINLPQVTEINENAFYNCRLLKSINLPKVTEISNNAFENCVLLTSIDLPKVTKINVFTFKNCKSLENVNIPQVTEISNNAFYNCRLLTSINLPKVTEINAKAFKNCESLENVNIPQVTEIGNGAFNNCESLKNVNIPKITKIGECAFAYCILLTSIDLPQVTEIGECAFEDCMLLTSIDLPQVTEINISAFDNCTSLKNVNIPQITKIGKYAFQDCILLTSIDLPQVTEINKNAFMNCESLETINLPQVTEINENAFRNCICLKNVNIPQIIKIGYYAFENCENIENINMGSSTNLFFESISISKITTDIRCFRNCNNIKKIFLNTNMQKHDNIFRKHIFKWSKFRDPSYNMLIYSSYMNLLLIDDKCKCENKCDTSLFNNKAWCNISSNCEKESIVNEKSIVNGQWTYCDKNTNLPILKKDYKKVIKDCYNIE